MKHFLSPFVFSAISLACISFVGVMPASAMESGRGAENVARYSRSDTPLMVIRFTHPNVIYEKSLYDIIARALQVRPNARFDIISVAKKSSDSDIQKQYNQIAARNSDKVMTTLHEMSVPDERLSFGKEMENVKYSEVRIYIHD